MNAVLTIMHAYIYILLYEKLIGENRFYGRWIFVLMFCGVRYVEETLSFVAPLQPLIIFSLLIIYSFCVRSANSNVGNLWYALITYVLDEVFHVIFGSVLGLIVFLLKEKGNNWDYISVVSVLGRLMFLVFLIRDKKCFSKIKQTWVLSIVKIISIIVLVLGQLICLAHSVTNESIMYAAIACVYMVVLFTILWLLDHYKMEKLQKMYADDNRQMSQKLHRSKEILPMIANYVSSMDGTQDEEMRKKLEAVCHDYGKELGGAEMSAEFFETTGIDLADLLLRTKIIECGEQDIELNVFVSTQINEDMKRLDISDGEITRLLGDLLRNAINAVSKLQDKMILLLIARNENDCVLIRIYDSGIPFPPYILEHFGERGYTTWGTGNGLADLMDTVTRVHGSIEINMDMDPGDVFTKEIYICFDGKNTINIVKKENTQREIDANVCMET